MDGAEVGTADEGDLFVYVEDDTTLTQSITAFAEGDTLLIGSGYAVTELATTAVLEDENLGSVSALDIFMQQDGANTVIYVETDTFQGNLSDGSAFQGETITLVGVDMGDVSIDTNGIVRYNDVAVA